MSTLTDQDAPARNYDSPGNLDSSPLTGEHDNLGISRDAATAERQALENLYDNSPNTEPNEKPSSRAATPTTAELRRQEENPEPPDRPTDEMLGKGFTGYNNRQHARRLAGLVTKRRSLVAGGVLGALLGGGGLFFSTAILPAQAINYSQILMNATKKNEHSQTITLGRLYRYMRTGKVGTTRLNALEYRLYPKLISSLESTGTKILPEGLTGQIRAVSLDPTKLSDLRGLSRKEAVKYISERYGVKPEKIYMFSEGGTIRFGMQDMPLKNRELVLKDIVRQNGTGKINSFIQMRLLRKYYGVPSMFHPLQRGAASLDAKTLELLRKSKSFRELEKNRTAKIAARSEAAKARLASIKAKATSAAGAATAAALAQGAICVAYDVAKDADTINAENFREPAVKAGADGMAVGEQVAANSPDVTRESIEAYTENFTDPVTKTTPFDAAAIHALEGKPGGVPTDPSLKAAFSVSNSARTMIKNLEEKFKADTVCSIGGQIAGGITGIALVIIGPGGWLLKGITTTASVAATQIVVNFIQNTVPRLIAEEPPIGVPHRGALGGMFDAYGARAGANEIAMASGGVAIDKKTALLRNQQWQKEEKEMWTKQPFVARIFNPYDYRSLAGRFVNTQETTVARQASKATASLLSLPASFFRLPSWLPTQKASAEQDVAFDWGFPEFDLSNAVLNNPRYADPYENADKTALLLDATGSLYTDRAKICFGAEIVKEDIDGAMVWAVNPVSKANMYTTEYEAANCAQEDNDSWNRVAAFVNSSLAMEAESCRLGRADSCTRVGQEDEGESTSFILPSETNSSLDQMVSVKTVRTKGVVGLQDITKTYRTAVEQSKREPALYSQVRNNNPIIFQKQSNGRSLAAI